MGWFRDWLASLPTSLITVNLDLSNLKSIKLLSDININSPTTIQASERDRKTLEVTVNPELLQNSPEQLESIKELMRLSVANAGGLLEDKTDQLLEEVGKFQSSPENVALIADLKTKIPVNDVPIWQAALYIRMVHQSGRSIDGLKMSIIDRYGDRGRNIANLCSTNYLEDIILPIYDELRSRPNFSQSEFNTQYEVIVTQYPFAVFVARSTPEAEVLSEITTKIKYNITYGIHSLNIHSIGEDNSAKVLVILEDPEVKQYFTNEPKININGKVLLAVVYF